MIQQVANTRTTKALTLKDIINVSYASCLNFFHTNTMFSPWKFNVFPVAYYFWVKRIDSSNYQYQSCYASGYYGKTPAGMNQHFDTVKTKKISDIQAMHPDLICDKDGDERVCIEYVYRFPPSPYDPKKLGFIIMRPSRSAKSIAGTDRSIFRYTIVITPKPGLFPIAN